MLSLVFIVLFSFMLFHEERAVIRSPLYLLGTVLSFLGVVAVLTKDPASLRPVLDTSSLLLLTTAVCWAIYRVWSKHIVMTWHPIPMFTVLAMLTSLGFLLLTFIAGHPTDLVTAGPRLTFIALFSGIMPIALAHPSFNHAQKNLGSAFCTSIGLVTPLITFIIAIIVLNDETFLWTQWVGAGVLIAGGFLVILAGRIAQRAIAAAHATPLTTVEADSDPDPDP
jgi:drug/metabolite transporter (DMT)-like permease